MALLRLLGWLSRQTDLRFRVLLYQDGPLAPEFAALAPTVTLTEVGVGRSGLVRRIGKLPGFGRLLKWIWFRMVTPRIVEQRPGLIYANSVASARLLRQVVPRGVPLVVHVHELENAIQAAAGPQAMIIIKSLTSRYVAMSRPVRQNLITNHRIDPALIELIPSFLPIDESLVARRDEHRGAMRRGLGIPDDVAVVAGCGAINWLKGVDLFVEMAGLVRAASTGCPAHFLWVGKLSDDEFTGSVLRRVQELGLAGLCHFVGERARPVELFCGCDLFVLSSREEAMGLVALEAGSVGKPIVCFAQAGGMTDFVANDCGRSVSPTTAGALAEAVVEILSSAELRDSMGRRAFQKVRRDHHIDVIAPRILEVIKSTDQTT